MTDLKINDKAIAFVSDWKKRAGEQQRKYTLLSAGAFVLTFIACVILFYLFQKVNYDRIVDQNMMYIRDSAVQEANQIETSLENIEKFAVNLAAQYANLVEFGGDLTDERRLEILCQNSIFDRIAFMASDGTNISLDGAATNVADRNYFQKGMQGESGWDVLEGSRITGRSALIFYAPVAVKGNIIGVMAGFFEQSKLSELFSYQLFNFQPTVFLLLGDGTEVANSKDKAVTENLLKQLSEKTFIGETDFAEIEKEIIDEGRAVSTFSILEGENSSIGVLVQFNRSDWMVLSILSHEIIEEMVKDEIKISINLLVAVIIVFLLLIFILSFLLQKQKKRLEHEMEVASRELEITAGKEARQLSIISSLGDMYSGIYYIDMASSEYQRIKEGNEEAAQQISDTGDANKGFAAYVEQFIDDAQKEEVRRFLEVATFPNRLEENVFLNIEYVLKDGGWRRATIVPAGRDEKGGVASVLFCTQVIDQEKQKELQTKKALQEAYEAANLANIAKTTFLSNMSHDIRTPMNAIIGLTAIASTNLENTDKIAECLKNIGSSSKHLLRLINEILDMSKIESGRVELCEEEFSLSELIDELVTIHRALIDEKNHMLLVKINNVTHEKVIGDCTRLQQVFTNLLSNAIKYTPAGGKIEIIISEKETNKDTIGWYEVVFQDNGIGISEEYQKSIFEPFTRAKDDRISDKQGTGLGMSIARNIVRMMNGDITVTSRINEGSRFTVSFALKLQPEEEVRYDSFENLPILVADDDEIACISTCNMLNKLSMNSEWVTTGKEAVEKIMEHHRNQDDYYAVIVDWKMPDMNGIETTKEIRKQLDKEIPIVIISAYDWSDIEQEARAAGANAFLSKPLFQSRVIDLFQELGGKGKKKERQSLKEELAEYDFTGKRILLVEDDDMNRRIAVELLAMVGLQTETAENGKIGMEMFAASEEGYYDLILMDVRMPVMNGYDATAAIRALSHPDAKKIPIIAMTANAFASDVKDAMKSGMNGHISKPIDVSHVVKVLKEKMQNE